ncbi:MAG TPA: hypothetical protein VF432_11185 [Thermoanaerobaculia bacterium]
MPITVERICFNWDTNAATNDAINIRTSYAAPLPLPEYVNGVRGEPCAYVTASVAGQTVSIRAWFSGGPANTTVQISATGNGTALGDVAATNVLFDPNGNADQVTMNLANTTFHTANVGIVDTTWTWAAGGNNTGQTTAHRSFILNTMPLAPWVQTPGSELLPWVSALERACTWAAGTGANAASVTAITRAVNTCGAAYNPGTRFLSFGPLTLDLTGVLAAMGGVGAWNLNCAECAATVTTLSRLLGINYASGEIRPTTPLATPKLVTTQIRGLGTPGWRSWDWDFHEVCWDNYAQQGHVWDASASLHDGSPGGYLSLGMQYDTGYEPALVVSGTPHLPTSDAYAIR